MHFNSFTAAAALALLACSTSAVVAESTALDQCNALGVAGEFDKAEPFCAQAATESQEGVIIYGDLLNAKGDIQAALKLFTQAHEYAGGDPELSIIALGRRALAHFDLENYSAALKDALANLEHWPDEFDQLTIAARIHPTARKRLEFTERAIKVKPEHVLPHMIRANIMVDAGNGKEALASAEKALKIAPKNAIAQLLKGRAHLLLGEHAKAESQFKALARTHPDDPGGKTGQATALLQMKRFEEAIKLATEALKIKADHLAALEVRATAHIAMGDGAAAMADITHAEKFNAQWVGEMKIEAQKVIDVHAAFTPEAFAKRAADRKVPFGYVTQHLRNSCGAYQLPRFDVNMDTDALNRDLGRYFDCLKRWAAPGVDHELYDDPPQRVIEATDRLHDAYSVSARANALRCSKMPKRAKCVDDEAYARADKVFDGITNPLEYVFKAEVARINNAVAEVNRAVKRHNTSTEVANFVQELARALNE